MQTLKCSPVLRCLLYLFSVAICGKGFSQNVVLPNAFAHNDYQHKRPLHDALENGFSYVEADVYLRGGRLVVAHRPPVPVFSRKRTLENLYLKPLFDSLAGNDDPDLLKVTYPITLVIDIKSNAGRTYRALQNLLEKYKPMLSSCENGKFVLREVTVVLTGKKPFKNLCCSENHQVFIDEDFRKVSRDSAANNLYPLASCKYSHFLKWRGKGEMPDEERAKLCAYVNRAHELGRKVRLWASPENKAVWKELLSCGVDLINTDKLNELRNFLLAHDMTDSKNDNRYYDN